MSCNGCAQSFGRKKETGCPICRYAFCERCLSHKLVVHSINSKKATPVCARCYYRETGEAQKPMKSTVPIVSMGVPVVKQDQTKSFLKGYDLPPPSMRGPSSSRIYQTQNGSHPSTVIKEHPTPQINKEDQELFERLDKLKKDKAKRVKADDLTEDEIVSRIAALKGIPEDAVRDPRKLVLRDHPQPNKSEAEQQIDFFNQMHDEAAIESGPCRENDDHLIRKVAESASGKNDKTLKKNEDTQNEENIEMFLKNTLEEARREADEAIKTMQKDEDIMNKLKEIKEDTAKEWRKEMELSKALSTEEVGSDLDDDEDDRKWEAAAKKAIAEAELEDRLEMKKKPSSEKWCSVCADDAALMCLACDNQFYCRACFKDNHNKEMLKSHKYKPI